MARGSMGQLTYNWSVQGESDSSYICIECDPLPLDTARPSWYTSDVP